MMMRTAAATLAVFTLIAVSTVSQQTVEQTAPGIRPAAALVESFDGLDISFDGPYVALSLGL